MSRLEEIKNQLEESNSYDDNPNGYWYHNIKWLIQQAEVSKEWQIVANNTYADLIKAERRVKELETVERDFWEMNKLQKDAHNDLMRVQQINQRYKQTIDLIEEGYRGSGEDLEEILDKLFYGGTSPVRGDKDE